MSDPELSPELKATGDEVVAALARIKMPFSHEWKYQPVLDQYQLLIDTPWSAEKGEKTTRQVIADAIRNAGINKPTLFVLLKPQVGAKKVGK